MQHTFSRLAGALGVGFALLTAACPGLIVVNEHEVDKVVGLIQTGDTARLEKLTQIPFLFDGEIIALTGDAGTLWNNLKAAGVSLKNARLLDLAPVRADSYKLFADTWEVSVFFKKYVPANGAIARVQSDAGTYLFLLGGYALDGYARVIGVKAGTP